MPLAVIVTLEVSPEAAKLLEGLVEGCHAQTAQTLTGVVPVHTRAKLETRLEQAQALERELARAIANPVEIELDERGERVEGTA